MSIPALLQVFVPGKDAASDMKGAVDTVFTVRLCDTVLLRRSSLATAEMANTGSRSKKCNVGAFHAKTGMGVYGNYYLKRAIVTKVGPGTSLPRIYLPAQSV
jgi:hypothetical protein